MATLSNAGVIDLTLDDDSDSSSPSSNVTTTNSTRNDDVDRSSGNGNSSDNKTDEERQIRLKAEARAYALSGTISSTSTLINPADVTAATLIPVPVPISTIINPVTVASASVNLVTTPVVISFRVCPVCLTYQAFRNGNCIGKLCRPNRNAYSNDNISKETPSNNNDININNWGNGDNNNNNNSYVLPISTSAASSSSTSHYKGSTSQPRTSVSAVSSSSSANAAAVAGSVTVHVKKRGSLNLVLPPGPLGIKIGDSKGCCLVRRITSSATNFQLWDVIDSLNGQQLHGKGLKHWVTLFQNTASHPTRQCTVTRALCLTTTSSKTQHTNIFPTTLSKKKTPINPNALKPTLISTNSAPSNCNTTTTTTTKKKNKALPSPSKKLPPPPKKFRKKYKKKQLPPKNKNNNKYIQLKDVPLEAVPYPGYVCSRYAYYTTHNNETCISLAAKFGMEHWKNLALVEENVMRYGEVRGTTPFKKDTLLRIPTQKCSKWKLDKLLNKEWEIIDALAVCGKCDKKELENDPDPMLICDGCDVTCHLSCAGLFHVPLGDWMCPNCQDVLNARKKYYHSEHDNNSFMNHNNKTLQATLPPLPEISSKIKGMAVQAKTRLQSYLTERNKTAIQQLQENQNIVAQSLKERIEQLKNIAIPLGERDVELRVKEFATEKQRVMGQHVVYDWNTRRSGSTSPPSWIKIRDENGRGHKYNRPGYLAYAPRWDQVFRLWTTLQDEVRDVRQSLTKAERNLQEAKDELANCQQEDKVRHRTDKEEHHQLLSGQQRDLMGCALLGMCELHDDLDVQVLNMLREPRELLLAIPMKTTAPNKTTTNSDDGYDDSIPSLVVGEKYAIFGCTALFQAERDDCLPMDLSGQGSIRVAQKRLVAMMLRTDQSLQVTKPSVPSSVHLRGDENLQQVTKCFDLSELVRDCNCPLNMPKAETPKRLADHGLVLRDYQQVSLQWMLDKERNATGMGFAGELWSRMQFLDGSGEFFFCETTGSLIKNIFDFKADVEQTDASKHYGSLPTAGILGEEMGLGKTVISLSLICANPPSLHNRVLPREHIAKIDHPLYSAPPSVMGCTSSNAKQIFLSNGTVVIAPMTLISQWQAEVERFAPWMSILTLHNDENPTVEEIASKDVVLVSTFLLQRSDGLFRKLKRIHFHRAMLDESHYNQTGSRTKQSLASLSASHRFCVTGTPIGHSLNDLQGQLRFLRVPQFCRSDFWTQNIGNPYCERNYDALQVLRSLLSRVVVRHSKEQTLENGNAMLSLPPRTVETILLPFGSPAEERLYKVLENRNTKRFMELRLESPKTVLGKFMELNGMIYSARQACGHATLMNLDNIHNLNARLANEERHKDVLYGRPKTTTRAGILEQAIENARPSAEKRMRETILMFHEGKIDLMECPVCLEPTGEKDIALTPCAHKFCAECIVNVLDGASSSREAKGNCPECRGVVRRSELTFLADAEDAGEKKIAAKKEDKKPPAASLITARVNGFQFTSKDVISAATGSTTPRVNYTYLTEEEKMEQRACCHTLTPEFLADHATASSSLGTKTSRLLEEIKGMMNKDPKSKCVVFSQFLGALDVASEEFKARGIQFVRIDGNMKQHQRADALLEFSSNPYTKVFLLSMRAGAAGLNLMAADHCFILDPPQNTAIEEQAIDRIHRIGQTRPVIVKRFIIKDSVEERILSNRRSLAADHPNLSTVIDGVGIMVDELEPRQTKRPRLDSTNYDNGSEANASFCQRFILLEALFGCSSTARVFKA